MPAFFSYDVFGEAFGTTDRGASTSAANNYDKETGMAGGSGGDGAAGGALFTSEKTAASCTRSLSGHRLASVGVRSAAAGPRSSPSAHKDMDMMSNAGFPNPPAFGMGAGPMSNIGMPGMNGTMGMGTVYSNRQANFL